MKFDLAYAGPPDPRFGSDFLTDTRTFDIVVLHWIFVGWDDLETQKPAIADHFASALSPKHSPQAWRARLWRSGTGGFTSSAGTCEVSGSWLLHVPGYRKHYASFGTIFDRNT